MIDPTEVAMIGVMLLGGAKGDLLDSMRVEDYWRAKAVTVTVAQLKRDAGVDAPVGDVSGLVKDLSSDDFKVREKARKGIEAMGPAAAPALQGAAKAKDPEVSQTAKGLLEEFAKSGHAREIRRLMAIRTLGERKEQAAAEMLKGLEGSTEPFVAAYARRAEAEIGGTAAPEMGGDVRKEVVGDVSLMPADAGLVLQGVRVGWGMLSPERIAEDMAGMERVRGQMRMNAPNAPAVDDGGGAGGDDNKAAATAVLMQKATKRLIKVAERMGDLRVDGMTMGWSAGFDGDEGWMVVVMRGEYEPTGMEAVMTEGPDGGKADVVEGVKTVGMEDGMALMPTGKELVLLYDDDAEDRAKRATWVAKALKGEEKDGVDGASELGKLLGTVDPQSVVWGAMTGMTGVKKEPMFAGVDSVVLSAKRGGVKGEELDFRLDAMGADEGKLKESKEAMEAGVKEMQGELTGMPLGSSEQEAVAPLAEVLGSVKMELEGGAGEGGKAAMTGHVPEAIIKSLLLEMGWGGIMDDEDDGPTESGSGDHQL